MADITKDSFNEANDFTKVVFQRGRDLMDFELNEFQDILRVFSARLGQVGVGLWQAAASISYPYSSDNGLEVVVSPTSTPNEVQVNAGTFIVDGIVQDYLTPTTLVLPAPAGTIQYDIVYIAVVESEVADPNAVPQIGPTTVRRQLTTTVMTYRTASLPFDPSFPVNPATWLWQGQTRYYPIAVVTRPALTAVVTAADILDLRRQTPSRTLAEASRVVDFKLEALITPALETPARNVNGIDNLLLVDINKTNSAGLVANNDVLTVRSRQQSGSAQTMATLTRYASATTGVAGRLALGTDYALYGTSVLRLQDDNIVNTGYPAPVTNKFVQLSSVANGASVLRIGEQGAVVQNAVTYGASTILAANNMLKAINGRLHVTVGDGTTSFGDFSGASAIEDALKFFADSLTAGATITSFEIDVKRGSYTVSAGIGSINIANNTNVTITGDNSASTIIQVPITVTRGFLVGTGATLTLKNIKMTGGASSIPLIETNASSALVVEKCEFRATGLGVVVRNVVLASFQDASFVALASNSNASLVRIDVGAGVATDRVFFNRCVFDTRNLVNVPVVQVKGTGSYSTDGVVRDICFQDCRALLSGATLSMAATAQNPSCVNTGLIDFAAAGANVAGLTTWTRVENIRIENCAIDVDGGSAFCTCLTALRLTMSPTGDFSGVLFTSGFIYLANLAIDGLAVTLKGTAFTASMVSPVIVGLYQADIDIQDMSISNVTTFATGFNSGKVPHDAYTYMTPTGAVAAAPVSGAAAPDAVAGFESSLMLVANRYSPLSFYALVQADLRLRRQTRTRINGLTFTGFEVAGNDPHNGGGELTVVASQNVVCDVSNVDIKNYSLTSTRYNQPDHRVALRTVGVVGMTPAFIKFRNSTISGMTIERRYLASGSITNPGSSYTDGFYAGVLLTAVTGSGQDATANITVAGGVVTNVVIALRGKNYVVGNKLTAALPGGTGFEFTVVDASINRSDWLLRDNTFISETTAVQSILSADNDNIAAIVKVEPTSAEPPVVEIDSVAIRNFVSYSTTGEVWTPPAIGCFASNDVESLVVRDCTIESCGLGIFALVNSSASIRNVKVLNCVMEDCGNIVVDMGLSAFGNVSAVDNSITSSIDTIPAIVLGQKSSDAGYGTVISNNRMFTSLVSNVCVFLVADAWPEPLPRTTVIGNSCNVSTTSGYIKINNTTAGGGTFPVNGHVNKAAARCVGMETIDTPYNSAAGLLYYIDDKFMVHNNARFKVGP